YSGTKAALLSRVPVFRLAALSGGESAVSPPRRLDHHLRVGRELPSGTVTFLFTDVEGSTRLLAELGEEAYAAALAEHRRVVREQIATHGGVEVDTQGDAFFVAFPTAPAALEAAAATRSALGRGPIRVRIGV